MTIDYESGNEGPSEDGLKAIGLLAKRQQEVMEGIAQLEDRLKKGKAVLRKIQEVDLPEAMAEIGCKKFVLDNGSSLAIEEGIAASLADGKKPDAIAWLIANGYGDIVTTDVVASFAAGEDELVEKAMSALAYAELQYGVKQDVNTARVKAIIKERMEAGLDVPMDTLGAFHWKKAVIKPPKK